MTERDVVIVTMGEHRLKARPAVVLRVGRALMLTSTSYFYRSNVLTVPASALTAGRGRCPPGLFAELLLFVHPPEPAKG